MFEKVRLIFAIVGQVIDTLLMDAGQVINTLFIIAGQVIGPPCLYCLLSLLRLIFKTYKNLTHFHIFLSYILVVWIKVELVKSYLGNIFGDFSENVLNYIKYIVLHSDVKLLLL